MTLINATAERGKVIGDRPKNYLMPYPQSEWALQINYSTPNAIVRPHYDTQDYVYVVLLKTSPTVGPFVRARDKPWG
jgi:hypothetical protein